MRLDDVYFEPVIDAFAAKLVGLLTNPYGNHGDDLLRLGTEQLLRHR